MDQILTDKNQNMESAGTLKYIKFLKTWHTEWSSE